MDPFRIPREKSGIVSIGWYGPFSHSWPTRVWSKKKTPSPCWGGWGRTQWGLSNGTIEALLDLLHQPQEQRHVGLNLLERFPAGADSNPPPPRGRIRKTHFGLTGQFCGPKKWWEWVDLQGGGGDTWILKKATNKKNCKEMQINTKKRKLHIEPFKICRLGENWGQTRNFSWINLLQQNIQKSQKKKKQEQKLKKNHNFSPN